MDAIAISCLERIANALERIADAVENEPEYHNVFKQRIKPDWINDLHVKRNEVPPPTEEDIPF